jgi:hypothetical protein
MTVANSFDETKKIKMKKIKVLSLVRTYAFISIIYPGWALGQQSTEVKMPAFRPAMEENYLNTVISTDTNGTKYKLVIIGDLLPKLYVNGKSIKADELKNYTFTIDRLTPLLWQRQKDEADKRNGRFEKARDAIAAELVMAGLVKNLASIKSFLLSANELLVNDKNQSLEVFIRFKNKFITSADQVFYFNKTTK